MQLLIGLMSRVIVIEAVCESRSHDFPGLHGGKLGDQVSRAYVEARVWLRN